MPDQIRSRIPTVDTVGLGKIMRRDSERWFPYLHSQTETPLFAFYTLGLAGEIGEVSNEIKKMIRAVGSDPAKLPAELADCFTYLLLLADELDINLFQEYLKKREINEARWGDTKERQQ
jgi:NTP pyrophosphatase (non-canonical NTP hydrolase)